MIYSDLVNGGYYAATDEKIALCLAYAPKLNKDTPCGRYVLSDDVYVNVMSYEPKPVEEAVAETHLVYADLQLILDGAAPVRLRRSKRHRALESKGYPPFADAERKLGVVYAWRTACAQPENAERYGQKSRF